MKALILALVVTLVACADAGPVQLSPDTYLIARSDKGGIFGNAAAMKVRVIAEANALAQSQGKIAIPISTHETPVYPGHLATIEYQFKVVDPDSPEAVPTALEPRPDVVIQRNDNIDASIRTRDETDHPSDIYSELLKLDDLRQRGILSDEEFADQKRKVLAGD